MNEQKLIQSAEEGKVSAMIKLAGYYKRKSSVKVEDKIGDIMPVEDLVESLEAKEIGKEKFKALAYKYYRMAAEAGNARAMTEVAHRLYDGIGVEKNVEESNAWYRRAAEAGDPAAMRVMAFLSEDAEEKFKYFKLSAELLPPGLNKQSSIRETAINYACGRGTDKDVAQAEEWLAKLNQDDTASARMEISRITGELSWLEQAAENSESAMIRMAEEFVLRNDFVNALRWYKKAAAHGSLDAMSIIGDIYYIGEDGITQDYTAAFSWYSRAADFGYNMAKIKLTLLLYRGRGVKQDLKRAFENFSEISWTPENFEPFGPYRFNSVARYYAALMRDNGEGCEKDPVDAVERYRVAGGLETVADYESARGIPKAIYKVADSYFLGDGSRQNFAKALHFYERTFNDFNGKTPYQLEAAKKIMCMYELGEGIPVDKAKAEQWRKKLSEPEYF